MKTLFTILLLVSINAMADSVVLPSAGDYLIINTDQPTNTGDKFQMDSFVVYCPDKNPATGEALRAIFRVNSASFNPAINATVVYSIESKGSTQLAGVTGGLTPIGVQRSITSDEPGYNILNVGTYGSNGAKTQQLIFGCYGVTTGVKIPMQLTPTSLPIDQSKGYVDSQIKFNAIK
jgi:hypothetical protein